MLTYQNHTVKTSVRRLVEFLLRSGNIDVGSGVKADVDAMQEGSRLHRKIQRAQKATYRSEVPLKVSWNQEEYMLVLEGRADGIDRIQHEGRMLPLIDEIKCVYRDVTQMEEAEPLHLAQAKCYACMYAREEDFQEIMLQITYCNMETEEKRYIRQLHTMEELSAWFERLIKEYERWASFYVEARKEREKSLRNLPFPFEPRPGQKKLMAMVHYAIEKKKSIFLQAPTGVGKTISTLYPALKGLGEEKGEKLFYLTAKTITRTVAEQTLGLLSERGMSLRAVSITSKERICPNEKADCNPASCSMASGHFDRINEALFALLTEERQMTREKILQYSSRYKVCPYELSFEAAVWADCIICDYNYVFDPHVNRKSLFGERGGNLLLIDEAHNLLDRARDMYSASLDRADFLAMKRLFKGKNKRLEKRLQGCNSVLLSMEKEPEKATESVDSLYYPLFWMLGDMEDYLKNHGEEGQREQMVEFYFRARHFFFIMENMGQGYEIYGEKQNRRLLLQLRCVDPSSCLEEYLEKCRCTVFFSATLLPVSYYKQLLGGNNGSEAFCIPSPFPKEKRLLAITSDVTSRYSRRNEEQYGRMVRYLEETVSAKSGNYMIFFPSYQMLSEVYRRAEETALSVTAELLVQEPSMSEEEREQFLERFQAESKSSLIGFCVLGSIFSEGIDLTGKRLIGALIVGTGLPQVCEEREKIRGYFDRQGKNGYDYAYRFPGMNKVLQAAGRVIRTAEDAGVILLMDDRFLWQENQELLPAEWDSYYPVHLGNYRQVLQQFWENENDEI